MKDGEHFLVLFRAFLNKFLCALRLGLSLYFGCRWFSARSLDSEGVGVGAESLQSLDASGRRSEVNAEANEGRSGGDQFGDRHFLAGSQHQRALSKREGLRVR